MKRHRWLILPLVFVLIFQLPVPLLGADTVTPQTGSAETKISLEQALQIVKQNFEISKELTEFTSSFSNYQSRQVWSLDWNTSGSSGGNFSAQVDAVSGEILSIYSWQSVQGNQAYTLPRITPEQARQVAEATVQKLTGTKYAKLKFLENKAIVPINLYGETIYSYNWQRFENGIPFQGNLVSVQVSASSGKVTAYNIIWNDFKIPEVNNIINAGQATEYFNTAKLLELQYFLAPAYKPLTTAQNSEKVQLVYTLKNGGTIDAFTGKPLVLNSGQWLFTNDRALGGLGSAESAAKSVPLTPQEQKEIAENAKLLTREKAIEAVKQWVEIPSNVTLKSINLYQDYSLRGGKVWSFEWGTPSGSGAQTINSRVNAASGELISFSVYSSSANTDGSLNAITSEQAQTIALDFIRKIQPAKSQQVKLNTDNTADFVKSAEFTSITFNYERIVNGILFPSNNISITVDLQTKKITSYYLNWWNLDFPQLSEAMSPAKVQEILFQARPMQLTYVLLYDQGEAKEVRLVYQPSSESSQTSGLIDARTGSFLDFQGNSLKDQPQTHIFTDIAGNTAEKEITVLGMAGLFGEYGSQFRPTENITASAFLRALYTIKNGSENNLPDTDVIKKAKEEGWIQDNLAPSQIVTKELCSQIIVRFLGLEKIAALNPMFQTSFDDVPVEERGYASLATGLGILKADNNKFYPLQPMTRADTAYALIRAFETGFKS
ncbi:MULTISPECIES: PepSY domain-containing protein [Dehalobacter]|uniref:Propeptide PepSY amd peptidase M4 n=2 Tax=Dehalobacter TaxID=56112 RepID=A0ABM5P4K4_DEHRP|nr:MULTISPECIES: PepSY domain-containing protein [Dehalobacter]AHF09509.1 propeptide PepSY amd peptidase M4 [Dehalobacter restrictus DSM 9455]MCG1025555.1 PepSY domain-containing protein [Dehalobacter sp.]OCZ54857.1 peptidase [Dehalobacter sp. TeCB1]